MTVLITLTTAGADSGPFNLYSDLDGYTSAFDADVAKSALLAGYASTVPDGTNIIRVMSNNAICTNFIDITVSPIAITCLQYSLTGGTAGTTYGYRDCFTDLASEITVGTGDTQTVCVNDAYVVYVISGDGTASSESICYRSTEYSIIYSLVDEGICTEPAATVFLAYGDDFVTGTTIYTDAAMTTPLLGYNFIVVPTSSEIFNIDYLTGIIGTSTELFCGV